MPKVDTKDAKGAAGTADLDDAMFGIEPNVAVMHQVVTAQLAAAGRARSPPRPAPRCAGGGAKPWKQKGTGRACRLEPLADLDRRWCDPRPKPRSYAQRTPKKMIRLALVGPVRPGRHRPGAGPRLGPRRPEHQGRHRRPGRQRRRGPRSRCSAPRTTSWKSLRNLDHVHTCAGPASSTPTTCSCPTGSSSRPTRCPSTDRHPRRARKRCHHGGRAVKDPATSSSPRS